MRLQEVLEKHEIVTDSKARRRSNVADKVANISAAEIEQGVTIERLTALNVPVFQYSTQITIHGTLPEFNGNARPAGYKSVFRNDNGSIGVRYVAIDGAKKEMLVEIGRYCKGLFNAHIDSKGLTVAALFSDKADCIKAYKEFPRDLFVGSVTAGATMFGSYVVMAEVGAIPQDKFPALVKFLFGVSVEEFQQIKAEQDARDEVERAERKAKSEQALADMRAKEETLLAEAAATITLPRLNAIPTDVGSRFVSLHYNMMKGKATPVLYVVTKKVFGKAYMAVKAYDGTNGDWKPAKTDKAVQLEQKRPTLEKRLAKGYIWKV